MAAILAAGMFLRLMDLTDEPLDFHPTAQLLRALTARGMYAQAVSQQAPGGLPIAGGSAYETLEPPILEWLVATTYQVVGGERPWVVRVWNALFWLIAALVLFDLARRSTSFGGGLVTLAYFLILPFGVQVSRAFIPDSLMLMLIVLSGFFLLRWSQAPSWGTAALAGLTSGAAILVKGRVAPMVLLTVALISVLDGRWRRPWRYPQVWAILALTVVIPWIYYGVIISRETAGLVGTFSLSLLWMDLDPSFYSRWLAFLDQIVYLGIMLLGLFGAAILTGRPRWLTLGWFAGFFATGLLLPYHITTHNYYTLPLVPAVALGLAPVGQALLDRARRLGLGWKAVAAVAGFLMVFYPAWRSRSVIVGNDYRGEPLGWQKIARELPTDGSIIAITQDYGYRLAYFGGRAVALWPSQADQTYAALRGVESSEAFPDLFRDRVAGFSYFLITNFGELDAQPELKQHLYDRFPVILDTPEATLFDLRGME